MEPVFFLFWIIYFYFMKNNKVELSIVFLETKMILRTRLPIHKTEVFHRFSRFFNPYIRWSKPRILKPNTRSKFVLLKAILLFVNDMNWTVFAKIFQLLLKWNSPYKALAQILNLRAGKKYFREISRKIPFWRWKLFQFSLILLTAKIVLMTYIHVTRGPHIEASAWYKESIGEIFFKFSFNRFKAKKRAYEDHLILYPWKILS